ncbi:hypothetical protein UFOVP1290_83 [uncultured Caudovirales phage]|uniref:Uncharacterized protein n=1 Tax=uncultured Caudovirales phage TaxID=2100421 RepID=A0A6J5RGV2_9CAUD|nr:hypothetical protein UFOVP1290_83 [uncultured Caudovirales phage]
MQSYEILLTKYKPFTFCRNYDHLYLCISDHETYPPYIELTWDNDGRNTSTPNIITCPTYVVSKIDYVNFVKRNMAEMIKMTLLIGVPENSQEYSLFTALKKIDNDNDNIEVALFCAPGVGEKQNKKIQKILDSYFNLKAFW